MAIRDIYLKETFQRMFGPMDGHELMFNPHRDSEGDRLSQDFNYDNNLGIASLFITKETSEYLTYDFYDCFYNFSHYRYDDEDGISSFGDGTNEEYGDFFTR